MDCLKFEMQQQRNVLEKGLPEGRPCNKELYENYTTN